ncbi:MAG: CrcB family protein [Asticcacaulis sp.]
MTWLLVAVGGAAGAMGRYGLGLVMARLLPGSAFPWATFVANGVGGLLMGVLAGWLVSLAPGEGTERLRLLLLVGLLGGFTTFSAYALDLVMLMERRAWGLVLAYGASSVIVSVAGCLMGLLLMRKWIG